MKMKKIHIILAFVTIFLCGMTIGFFVGKAVRTPGRRPPRPRGMQEMLERKVTRQLKLTDEQRQTVQPAYEKWSRDMMEMNRRNEPEVKKIFFTLFDDIARMAQLADEQLKELEIIREKTAEHISFRGRFRNPPEKMESRNQSDVRADKENKPLNGSE